MGQPVVHFEIGCKDRAAAAAFYTALFGWSTHEIGGGEASMIDTGSSGGIQGHFNAHGHEPHHYTMIYIQVDDIPAALARAESLGGKTLVPLVTIPDGAFAWFADPEGTAVGLWTPKTHDDK